MYVHTLSTGGPLAMFFLAEIAYMAYIIIPCILLIHKHIRIVILLDTRAP